MISTALLAGLMVGNAASAETAANGVTRNGIRVNGLSRNGLDLNGAPADRAAVARPFDFSAVTVQAVTLPDRSAAE